MKLGWEFISPESWPKLRCVIYFFFFFPQACYLLVKKEEGEKKNFHTEKKDKFYDQLFGKMLLHSSFNLNAWKFGNLPSSKLCQKMPFCNLGLVWVKVHLAYGKTTNLIFRFIGKLIWLAVSILCSMMLHACVRPTFWSVRCILLSHFCI